jgi:hypothetical protein
MLGYTSIEVEDMIYSIGAAILIINTDENPAIHRGLSNAIDLLEGLLAEGHIQ